MEFSEKRRGLLVVRGLRVFSRSLGITGSCDVVEFYSSPDGIHLAGREGLWLPIPVEYKRGSSKENDADRLQLCAQGLCLEEMLACPVPHGFLFYGETKRREPVEFTPSLRQQVSSMFTEMHQLFSRGYTPKGKPSKSCNACSLRDLCLPKLCSGLSAQQYIAGHLSEEEEL